MTPEEATDLVRLTLVVAVEISAPILVITLLIGLGVSIFQSVTQVHETTLIFIPKLLCFTITFALTFPWIIKVMTRFMYDILFVHWNHVMFVSTGS